MPILETIGLAAGVAQNAYNAIAQGNMNNANRNFAENMYALQRRHALEDRDYANEYNSPKAQMARLKEAGLNPNLVYGSPSAVSQSSSPVRASSADYKGQPSQLDASPILAGLMAMYNIRRTEVQTDNLRAQKELIKAQIDNTKEMANLNQMRSTNTDASTSLLRYNVDFLQGTEMLRKRNLEATINKIEAETKTTLDNNERQKLLTANTLRKGAEEVLLMRKAQAKTDQEIKEIDQKIELLRKENTIKGLDANDATIGVSSHDNSATRWVIRLLNWK